MRRIRDFLRDQAGNAAITFGLAAVPLIALAGGAVDFAHRANVRADLQSAADTAALAAARIVQNGQLSRDEDWGTLSLGARDRAEMLINAALASLGENSEPTIDIAVLEEAIRITAHADVPTSFLGVIGIRNLGADAFAEVNLPEATLVEMALVLDYSASMRDNDKYIRMTSAARDFIGKVKKDRGDRSKIGIVPFSEYVYARVNSDDLRDSTAPYGMVDACLVNRDYPYSATNEPPYSGLPESQWPEVDPSECEPYVEGGAKVHDLTDEFDALSDALAAMQPIGFTNIALGMELGWHMLSPGRPFETTREYSDEHLEKIIILLTDGMQTVKASGPDGTISIEAADEVTAELCESAKGAGVTIFSIAYDVDDESVQNLLRGCASSETAYFDARAVTDISGVFDNIYSQILESAWLSR